MRSGARLFLIGLLVTSACTCGTGDVNRSDGVLVSDATGTGGLAFGRVRVGESLRRTLVIFNNGNGLLQLTELRRTGDGVAAFTRPQFPSQLQPGQSESLTIAFTPEAEGDFAADLVFVTDSEATPELRVPLTGRGVLTKVSVNPGEVDYGLREVGVRETRLVTVKNDGEITEQVKVTPFPNQSPHYQLGDVLDENGFVVLDPGASAELPVVFAPQFAGSSFTSSIEVLPCPTCAITEVPLTGSAVAAFLTVEPTDCLDFGLVNPGSAVERAITLGNLGDRDVQVTGAVVDLGTSHFTVPGSNEFPLGLGQGQRKEVKIVYAPTALESNVGSVVISTDDPTSPQVRVCLRGSGGGPDALVTPPALDFGLVAVGTSRTRTLRLSNVGIAGDAPADLVFTGHTFDATPAFFSSDLAAGLAVPFGASRTVSVTYAPTAASTSAGHAGVMRLATNDSDSPEVEVLVAGRAVALPPCNLEVVPGDALAFGNVDRNRTATLRLSLRNAGDNDCLVSSLDIDPTGSAAFTLVDGPVAERLLQPLEILAVPVSFKPTAFGRYASKVRFEVSDPAAPLREVALSGLSESGCLLIAPNEIDFGTVGAQCNSREMEVTIYNTCTTGVAIQSITLAADPDAPFVLTNVPASFPVNVTSSVTQRFRARYSPRRNGTDVGAVFVKSSERAEPYNIGVRGRAAEDAIQRDRFVQQRRPAVDLLFVVDNSGSMGPYQAALAQNFDAFMRYANQQQIDYRIGITTTDITSSGARGRLIPTTGSRPRILTPETANVESEFATTVNVGSNGSADERGLEAMYLALTPPLVDTPIAAGGNGGFLRPDALLSVIVITDETDSSNQSVAFYLNFLRNLKGANRSSLVSLSTVCDQFAAPGSFGDCSRYATVANATTGLVSNVRTENWAADLERLGAVAFGYKTRFFLTSVPADPSQLQVLIDGIPVPQNEGAIRNWTFNAQANAIDFSILSLPEPGSVLEVNYLVACGR